MRLQSCRRTVNLEADGRGCFFIPCQVAGLNVPVHQTLNFLAALWDGCEKQLRNLYNKLRQGLLFVLVLTLCSGTLYSGTTRAEND
jgi:hypothetical protein